MLRRGVVMTFLLCLLSIPALAHDACYSPADLMAEQWLRLHSELMVLTVTCRTGSQGQNLVPAYTGFTHDNIRALHDAEQTMIHYYDQDGRHDGIAKLDHLRTRLGNEYGMVIANISAPVFCRRGRDKVLQYYYMTGPQVRAEVRHMAVADRSYEPLCNSTRVARKSR